MKISIVLVSVTGSCALLYLLYRLKIYSKKKPKLKISQTTKSSMRGQEATEEMETVKTDKMFEIIRVFDENEFSFIQESSIASDSTVPEYESNGIVSSSVSICKKDVLPPKLDFISQNKCLYNPDQENITSMFDAQLCPDNYSKNFVKNHHSSGSDELKILNVSKENCFRTSKNDEKLSAQNAPVGQECFISSTTTTNNSDMMLDSFPNENLQEKELSLFQNIVTESCSIDFNSETECVVITGSNIIIPEPGPISNKLSPNTMMEEEKSPTRLNKKTTAELNSCSEKKSNRQKRRKTKRGIHSKELQSSETSCFITPDLDSSSISNSLEPVPCLKSDLRILNCISQASSSRLDKITCPITNQSSTTTMDQNATSDLERETSISPDQEIPISDSQSLNSQASLDSGEGGSIEMEQESSFSNVAMNTAASRLEQYTSHQFEVPQLLVGKLIGRRGAFLNKIKATTSTTLLLVNHTNEKFKLCSIEGKKWQVQQAMEMIREHFPVDQFSELSLAQAVVNNGTLPQHLFLPSSSPSSPFPHLFHPIYNRHCRQIEIPAGVVVEVQASAVISTGELWVQQPLHPTFSALQTLHHCLNRTYGDGSSSPLLPVPIQPTTICVCRMRGQWFRCQVVEHTLTDFTVTLLDVGGHVNLPHGLLRQIRVDCVGLPFQASQCYLFGIQPCNESGWEESGAVALREFVKNNIVYATIAAYSQDGIPLVNLYQRHANQITFINERLVELRHSKWITTEAATSPSSPQSS